MLMFLPFCALLLASISFAASVGMPELQEQSFLTCPPYACFPRLYFACKFCCHASAHPHLHCTGTGLREAVSLLESMLGDGTDFVRQGASIALALVLVQQPESVVEPFRKRVRGLAVYAFICLYQALML
jgi:hypothetical protein